jgi:DNA-binding LytR/AlgR family response regulator
MIKALIVEDEPYARKELKRLLNTCSQEVEIIAELDSVKAAVHFLQDNNAPDLLLFDIQLADGLSFEIFEQIEVNIPVIFTTAYDQFTLKAFKLLSVDYILKPVEPDSLQQALNKFESAFGKKAADLSVDYRELARQVLGESKVHFKKRFLGKLGHKVIRINADEIAYFLTEDHTSWLVTNDQKVQVDQNLEQLEEQLDPDEFFRVNRQMIVNVNSITRMERYGQSQWMLVLHPDPKERILVSRARSTEFLAWMDR